MNDISIPDSSGKVQNGKEKSFRSQIGPLLFLCCIFFLNFISRIILAPMMPTIEKELGIGHGGAGSFFFLISLGYFPALLGSGFVSSRITHRKTIILSSVMVGLAFLGVSFISSLWGIRIGLIILGVSSGIYLPSGIATLTSLVGPRNWGKALAVHELAPTLGFVTAPLLSEALLGLFSWRGVLALLGGTSVFAGVAFARFGRGGEFPGEAPGFSSFRTLLAVPSFWIMMSLFILGIAATMGIYTMLPLYLVSEQGIDRSWANTLVGLSRISVVGMVFLSGWATDRFGPRRILGGIFLLSGIMTVLLGIVSGPWVIIIVFLQPLLGGGFFPAAFAALSRVGPHSARNIAVSLTVPVAFVLGGGAIPTGIGIMGDAGFFALGISLVGALLLTGCVLVRYLKFQEELIPDGK